MLLADDPRLPSSGFIGKQEVETLAAAAIQFLDTLGFVGILERGQSAWDGVGHISGVKLERHRSNVTGELGSVAADRDDVGALTAGALELLEERTAVDALIYDQALDRAGLDKSERNRVIDDAFASQLVRLGDLCGVSAASAARLAATADMLNGQLRD